MPKLCDAFLSYNSLDRSAVLEVYERLKGEGLSLYMDVKKVPPGEVFQPALAEGLHQSKTCVVFLGPNGLGPWPKEELQVAIDKRARDSAFRVIPVLLPGAERPRRGNVAHLEFLINASWVEFLKTLDEPRAFQSLLWGITGERPRDVGSRYEGVCPYRGLEAFRPEDAPFFFGREALKGWLVSALRREVQAPDGVRVLGVLGPSGSGKSSVVMAGLLPQLKAGAIAGSEHWPVAVLRPGDDPLKNLAVGVVAQFLPVGALPDMGQAHDLINALRDPEGKGLDVFARIALRHRPEHAHLVVVVDQLEEVFTYRPQEDQIRARFEQDRARFFGALLNAAAAPGGRVAVVVTMRSDFLGACAVFPQLAAVLSAHQELVGPMTAAELREAIERPAFLAGCEVEPALTERLLADVEGQAGALPLLQFALTEVWKKRDGRRLTLRAYTALGEDGKGGQRGIEGVLERRANEIYRNLKPEEQELCRRVFLRLVQPGEGAEDTKRRVTFRELLPDDPARAEQVIKLVRTLADRDARLITTEGDDTANGAVEVAHEALIRGWGQLRGWVDAERTGLRIHRRLTEAAQEWAGADPEHKESYLHSGARLAVCLEWAQPHRDELSPTEAAFLGVSAEAEQQRKQDALEDERRLREAAEIAQAAERSRAEEAEARTRDAEVAAARQKRLNRGLVITVALASLLAAAAAGLAWWAMDVSGQLANDKVDLEESEKKAKKESERATTEAVRAENNEKREMQQRTIADSRRLAALSELERGRNLDRALLLAVESWRKTPDGFEARCAFLKALQSRPGLLSFLRSVEGRVHSLAISPDRKTLAVGFHNRDDQGGGGVTLWDLATRQRLEGASLNVGEGVILSLAFSPDGKTLAAGYGGGAYGRGTGGVTLWETVGRPQLEGVGFATGDDQVRGVAFSPDGKTLAISSLKGFALWDVAERKLLDELALAGHNPLAFDARGQILAVGEFLWDVASRRPLAGPPLKEVPPGLQRVALSPDGGFFAAAYGILRRGAVYLWDLKDHKRIEVAGWPSAGEVYGVAFSPDGKTLAAGILGDVALWDVAERKPKGPPLPVANVPVSDVAFSPDGKYLAAAYNAAPGGVVLLWSLPDLQLLTPPLAVNEGEVHRVAFAGDGRTLAAGFSTSRNVGPSGGVVLWDVAYRQRLGLAPLVVGQGGVYQVAFDKTGTTLAAGFMSSTKNSPWGVVLFALDPVQWVPLARRVANRNLTRAEWRQYLPDEPYRRTFKDLPEPADE
jgi:WD40 repeat protein